MRKGKIAIVYNEPSTGALPDELDILDQVQLVEDVLRETGIPSCRIPIGFRLDNFISSLKKEEIQCAVNLTESIANHGELLYFAPAVLNCFRIPYTGVRTERMFLTTSKTLAKEFMRMHGLPTADWFRLKELSNLDPSKTYLVKPILEDGSLGFDEEMVFRGNAIMSVPGFGQFSPDHYFIEEYIEGREFNISVLCGKERPEVMPLAEIVFQNFPVGKPRIVGYKAKWEEESFESRNTQRMFLDEAKEPELASRLRDLSLRCWDAFGLNGYVRIDFRMNGAGELFILEINANPCISPGAGFHAACEKAGYSFRDVMIRILDECMQE